MNARIDSQTLYQAPDWSRLIVWAKRTVAVIIVIGLVGGSIVFGEWPHELPGKLDAPHNETSEVRDGPPMIATITSATALSASGAMLTRPSR